MTQYTREYILDYGIKRNQTAGKIDSNLKKFGHGGLTVSEFNKISPIQNLGKDLWRNTKEFGQGIAAMPGVLYNTAKDEGVGGLVDLAKQIPEGLLTPYNLSYEKIKSGDINGWDILQGAKENPLNTVMDITGIAGITGIGKGLPQALAKSKLASKIEKVSPGLRKAILPTKEEKLFNKALAHADVGGDIATARAQKAAEIFTIRANKKGVDRTQLFNNLVKGTLDGNEATIKATEAGKLLGTIVEKQINRIGALTPDELALNRQAQHLVYNNPLNDITHGEALDFINKVNTNKRVPSHVKELVNQAKLADEASKLVYVPQLLEHNQGMSRGLGEAVLNLTKKDRPKDYFSNVREIGNAAPEQIGKNLPDEFAAAVKNIKNVYAADEALNALKTTLSKEATYDKVLELSKTAERNEIIIPKKYLTEDLKKDLMTKGGNKIIDELMNDRVSVGKVLRDPKKAEDFIVVNKNDLKAIANSLSSAAPEGTLGKINAAFKTGVLGKPKWFVENRTDNWSNMLISGVDFGEAVPLTFEYWKKIPQELDMTTAYQSLTGLKTSGLSYGSGFKLALEKLKQAYNSKAPLDFLKTLNTITGGPIYRLEAFCERFERATCFMDQVNKYAKANKISVPKVLELVDKDKSLFWSLYKKVDDVLGDYTGRNYYLPNQIYQTANLAMPFWKYPTQSIRLWGKQAYNHPLLYQGLASAPGEIGREYNRELMEKYKLDPETFTGGALYKEPYNGLPLETIQVPGSKFAAVPEMIGDIFEPSNNKLPLFPIVDPFNSLINFKNPFGKTPTMEGVVEQNGKLFRKDKNGRWVNYEPTMADRLRLMARGLLDTNVHAAGFARYTIRPSAHAIVNKSNKDRVVPMYGQYDMTLLPFGGINPNSIPKTTPLEMVGKQAGIRVANQYKPFKMTKSQLNKIKIKQKYKQRNIQNKLRRDSK